MDKPRYDINELVELKKPHPCGSRVWLITRTGIDFALRCQGCGHRVMITRKNFERSVRKKVVRDASAGESL